MSNSDEDVEKKRNSSLVTSNCGVALLSGRKFDIMKGAKTVLPEEEYLDGLQKIIVKDYFPELPKLKAQKEYLDAIASNDLTRVRELQLRYSTKRTDRLVSPFLRRSPEVFDPESPGPSKQQISTTMEESNNERNCDNFTVDSYLNKFTSEDNASFEELAALHSKRERITNAWMYDAEVKHNKELVHRGPEMVAAADEQLMISASSSMHNDKPKDLDNWTYKARNSVLFNVDEVPLTVEEHLKRQKMSQKIINKEATRLPENVFSEKHMTMNKTELQTSVGQIGKIDVTGHEIGATKTQLFELVSTPSPAPGVDESPFMTWGEIEGTPFRLDASDLTPSCNNAPTFKIPEAPVREQIAHGISEKIAQRYRDKRNAAIRQAEKLHTKTPSFGSVRSSERLLLMSPAARRLATKGLGIRLGSDKSFRASYTPSPLSVLKTPSLRSPIISRRPWIREHTQTATSSMLNMKEHSSITDNLLNFGESTAVASTKSKSNRPTAADFF